MKLKRISYSVANATLWLFLLHFSISTKAQIKYLAVGERGTFVCIPEPEYPYTGYGYCGWDNEEAPNMGFTHNPIGDVCTEVGVASYFSGTQYIRCTYTWTRVSDRGGTVASPVMHKTFAFRCSSVPTLINLYISPTSLELTPGESHTVIAWATGGAPTSILWTSSNSSVAKVTNNVSDPLTQTITAVSPGQCTITISSGGSSASCSVTVKYKTPESISLPNNMTVKKGQTVTLKPTFSPSDANSTLSWTSDNPNVAIVNSSGVVTGKKTGTARITVTTDNGKTDYCDVAVEKGDLTLNADKASGLYAKGSSVSLTANFSDADIYYTLDGSTPTENSPRYTGPIAINENLTLKAIAMGSEYNPSSIVSISYQITSLAICDYTPKSGTIMDKPHVLPSATFSDDIFPNQEFGNIRLIKDNTEIAGQCYIQGCSLIFVPNEIDKDPLLKEGHYSFIIPSYSVKNESGEVNMALDSKFTVEYPTKKIINCVDDYYAFYFVTEDGTLYRDAFKQTDIDDVAAITRSSYNKYVIKKDGTLWVKGTKNDYGQLGIGKNGTAKVWTKIMDGVKKMQGGSYLCYALKTDGSLWAWGDNEKGRLGTGGTGIVYYPQKIMDGVKDIATDGVTFGVAVKTNGSLWEWGENLKKYNDIITTPKQTWASGAQAVACGDNMVIALKTNGDLYTWGKNYTDIDYYGTGRASSGMVSETRILTNVKAISSCQYYSLAIKNDDSLWGWGCFYNKQGSNITPPKKLMDEVSLIAAGFNQNAVIKKNGTVWKWDEDNETPTQVNIEAYSFPNVSEIYVPESISLHVNSQTAIIPLLEPANAVCSSVQFQSSNFNVVSVSSSGILTAKEDGIAYVTVTVDGQFEASCLVEVQSAYKVKINTIENGNITASAVEAKADEEVILTLSPDGNFILNEISIVDNKGLPVEFKRDGNTATFKMPESDVTVSASLVQRGDLDVNGIIDVADMVLTINHVLGKAQQDASMIEKMDMNGDGQVDVGDVILIIKAILAQGGQVVIPAEARGKAETVDITKYTAMQLNVTVPTGTQIADVQLAGLNSVTHQQMYLKTGDDSYTVVVYSLDNQTFSRVEGSLLKVTLDGDGEAVMSNVLLATPMGERTFVGSMPTGSTTGIRTVGSDEVNTNTVYDLRGHKMRGKGRLPKGVYIVNGKKVIK